VEIRDNFSPSIKRTLAQRVGYRCSRSECRALTTGPSSNKDAAISVGVAAHIAAAAPGGPRYDASMDSSLRSSVDNGLWLCQTCATLIDRDPGRFNARELYRMKAAAEERALRLIGKPDSSEIGYLLEPTPPSIPLDSLAVARYIRRSKRLEHFDVQIASEARCPLVDYDSDGEYLIEKAAFFSVHTLDQLDLALETHGEHAVKLATGLHFKDIARGCTISFIFEIMACQLPAIEDHIRFYDSLRMTSAGHGFAGEVRKIYKQILEFDW